MKNRLLLLLVHLVVFTLFSCSSDQKAPLRQQFSSNRIRALNKYLNEISRAYSIPGLSVGVIHQDSVFNKSLGIADNEKHLIDSLLPFSAGSISEPMVATAILKLLDSGLIKLDDPVQQYLPYFKTAGKTNKKITIRHLLSHTSGIQHYPLLWDTPDTSAKALETTTRSISSQQLKFPFPGTRVVRSPYNYDILADLIGKVTKKPFEDYIDQQVFQKMGMKSSSFSRPAITVQPFSVNNWLTLTSRPDSIYPYNRENSGSNGLHTTAADLSIWMEMLLNKGKTRQGVFVNRAAFDDFFAAKYMTGKLSGITFGWEFQKEDDQESFTKTSSITHFQNQILLIPGQKIGITFLSNSAAQPISAEIIRNITNWLQGGNLPVVKIPVGLVMGKKLQETGSIDSAIHLYQSLRMAKNTKYELNSTALNSFGGILFKHVNNQTAALKLYEFAATVFPSSAEPYLHIADIYIKSRAYANAIIVLKKSRPLMNRAQMDYAFGMEQYIKERTTDQDPG